LSQLALDHYIISDRNHLQEFWDILLQSIQHPFRL
jgi:hypothetical protein